MHLPRPLYALVRRAVPIVCVDTLPYRMVGADLEAGLIRRVAEDGRSTGWALVGGRVRREETLQEALERHLCGSLGKNAQWHLPYEVERPLFAAQYFPHPRAGQRPDPRQHAIALSYLVEVTGEVSARGEALDFRWFQLESLPPSHEIVFGQASVIEALVSSLRGMNMGKGVNNE